MILVQVAADNPNTLATKYTESGPKVIHTLKEYISFNISVQLGAKEINAIVLLWRFTHALHILISLNRHTHV